VKAIPEFSEGKIQVLLTLLAFKILGRLLQLLSLLEYTRMHIRG
jgi:hypothetical protein